MKNTEPKPQLPDLNEDDPNFREHLNKILEDAGKNATERLLAKGIPVTYMEGDVIIRKYPDGRKEEVLTTNN